MIATTVATQPRSAPARGTTAGVTSQRITRDESLWFAIAAVLLLISSLDAVREIPPLADDYWMMASMPGAIAREYVGDHGWGRFIGIWLVDSINTVRAVTGAPLLALILLIRGLVLASIYVTFRKLFAFAPGAALLGVAVMAWNPPAAEAWVLLCNLHLAVSVIPVLIACGLFGRALGALPVVRATVEHAASRQSLTRMWMIGAAAAQLIANFVYEQALLAIPAFVAVLAILGRRPLPSRLVRLTALGVATGTALVSGLVMVATGYVASRSQTAASAAELRDLGSALNALWIGFGQHHIWRAIEAVRVRQLLWWDASLLGVAAGAATVVASVLVAWQLTRDRHLGAAAANMGLAAAATAGTYATLLPMGLAYPGYTIISRLYYLPGAFIALAIAALVPVALRGSRLALGLGAGAALLWLGIVTRRYYEDVRQGSRILRVVARSMARVPAAVRTGGVLVIAPSNVGTFSTSAVEPWSLRPAVRQLAGINPEGPLFLATDCAQVRGDRPEVRREAERARPMIDGDAERPLRWGAVLRYGPDGARIAPSIAVACGR